MPWWRANAATGLRTHRAVGRVVEVGVARHEVAAGAPRTIPTPC